MPLRLFTVLAAALALLPAAAHAQQPTATPGPPNSASDAVKLIYEDYRRDGAVEACDHERADLQDALDTIEPDFDTDYPDFRVALEAGIQRHDAERCDGDGADPTATAQPTTTPEDGGLSTPEAGADDGAGTLPPPENGTLPPPEDGTLPPPEDGTVPPEEPAPTVPPTTNPPPEAAPAAAPTPSVTPAIVSSSRTDNLLVPGIILAIALLGALALALSALAARRDPRIDHAWREAAFRTRATWADFTDWLRLGR